MWKGKGANTSGRFPHAARVPVLRPPTVAAGPSGGSVGPRRKGRSGAPEASSFRSWSLRRSGCNLLQVGRVLQTSASCCLLVPQTFGAARRWPAPGTHGLGEIRARSERGGRRAEVFVSSGGVVHPGKWPALPRQGRDTGMHAWPHVSGPWWHSSLAAAFGGTQYSCASRIPHTGGLGEGEAGVSLEGSRQCRVSHKPMADCDFVLRCLPAAGCRSGAPSWLGRVPFPAGGPEGLLEMNP